MQFSSLLAANRTYALISQTSFETFAGLPCQGRGFLFPSRFLMQPLDESASGQTAAPEMHRPFTLQHDNRMSKQPMLPTEMTLNGSLRDSLAPPEQFSSPLAATQARSRNSLTTSMTPQELRLLGRMGMMNMMGMTGCLSLRGVGTAGMADMRGMGVMGMTSVTSMTGTMDRTDMIAKRSEGSMHIIGIGMEGLRARAMDLNGTRGMCGTQGMDMKDMTSMKSTTGCLDLKGMDVTGMRDMTSMTNMTGMTGMTDMMGCPGTNVVGMRGMTGMTGMKDRTNTMDIMGRASTTARMNGSSLRRPGMGMTSIGSMSVEATSSMGKRNLSGVQSTGMAGTTGMMSMTDITGCPGLVTISPPPIRLPARRWPQQLLFERR